MRESLRAIWQAITRYSANAPELPVNDAPLFTGALSRVTNSPMPGEHMHMRMVIKPS
jgi:hypothetical protein